MVNICLLSDGRVEETLEDGIRLNVIVDDEVDGEYVLSSVVPLEFGSGRENIEVLPGDTTLWLGIGLSQRSTLSDGD